MANIAADWAILVERRHTRVQRDTVELNLSIGEQVRELRVVARGIGLGVVRDLAHEA